MPSNQVSQPCEERLTPKAPVDLESWGQLFVVCMRLLNDFPVCGKDPCLKQWHR